MVLVWGWMGGCGFVVLMGGVFRVFFFLEYILVLWIVLEGVGGYFC